MADPYAQRPNGSKGFEPAKVRKLAVSEAYVLSLAEDGRWFVVDHFHGAADGGEIRYPGLGPLEAMEASARARTLFCERRDLDPATFLAVGHGDLDAYGIDPVTRITRLAAA